MCEAWSSKEGTSEYEAWFETHESECTANHTGSSGKMEVDAIVEMFKRSENLHSVKYVNYIVDGDSKTFAGVVNANPYGQTPIKKKECNGHVQKRMGHRLRECKKRNKGLGGKGKLTAKLIDKLTVYYGLAIRRNCNSAEDMKKAIWATFYHYSSTDNEPKHQNCPPENEPWCEWQREYAVLSENEKHKINDFVHSYKTLPADVLNAIQPIYKSLSEKELLDRCVGGFTKNNNESFKQLVWMISPKHFPGGILPVEIAAYTSVCIFNEGTKALIKIMEKIGISCCPNIHSYAKKTDEARITIAEHRAQENTKESRTLQRQRQLENLETSSTAKELMYAPGFAD